MSNHVIAIENSLDVATRKFILYYEEKHYFHQTIKRMKEIIDRIRRS